MKGSRLDLEAAYKQLAVREDHKKYAVVGLPRRGTTQYYVLNALAFGASADVLHFNRAARAVNHLCHEAAGCAVTNFFDDFICIAPTCVIDQMYERCKIIINLMGWKLKEKSIIKPDYEFVALGVVIRFCDDARTIMVMNKKERIDKLRTQIDEIRTTKMLSPSTVQRLRRDGVQQLPGQRPSGSSGLELARQTPRREDQKRRGRGTRMVDRSSRRQSKTSHHNGRGHQTPDIDLHRRSPRRGSYWIRRNND